MTLFSWYLHTSSYVLSSLWNTVSLNLKKRKNPLRVWSPPSNIPSNKLKRWSQWHNTCNDTLQVIKKITTIEVWERAYVRQTGKMKGHIKYSDRDVLANVSLSCPVLLKTSQNKSDPPHFFLQSDKHTRIKITYHHDENKKKNPKRSSIQSEHTLLREAPCPTKSKQKWKKEKKQTKQNLSLVLCWWPPLGNDWKQQSLKGTCVHLTNPHKPAP